MGEPEPSSPAESNDHLRWNGPAPQVYANVMAVAPGPFDMLVVFGYEDSTTRDGENVKRTEVARISMSWGHVKSMIPLLANVVAQYEEQVGEIPAPGFDQMWKR